MVNIVGFGDSIVVGMVVGIVLGLMIEKVF